MEYLFVYGSLMGGEEREGLLFHLSAVPATAPGRLWRAAAGYPAFEYDHAGAAIRGELVGVEDPQLLRVLDLVEGVSDGLYSRVQIPVAGPDGSVTAWTYVMDRHQRRRAGCTPIPGTDWRAHHR